MQQIGSFQDWDRMNENSHYNRFRLNVIFEDSDLHENNDQKRLSVINAIEAGDWETQNAGAFKTALEKSKHKEMLGVYTTSELNKMKLFKLSGFDIGYALKKKDGKYSEIVSVFNNESDVRGIGNQLINSAVANGGCYLDHYDGFLSDLYQSLGFVEYERYKFDPQYDKGGKFQAKYGKMDVIFRKHQNCR